MFERVKISEPAIQFVDSLYSYFISRLLLISGQVPLVFSEKQYLIHTSVLAQSPLKWLRSGSSQTVSNLFRSVPTQSNFKWFSCGVELLEAIWFRLQVI